MPPSPGSQRCESSDSGSLNGWFGVLPTVSLIGSGAVGCWYDGKEPVAAKLVVEYKQGLVGH